MEEKGIDRNLLEFLVFPEMPYKSRNLFPKAHAHMHEARDQGLLKNSWGLG